MKNRHSVLLGLITVIIRILDFALFRLLLPGSESQERLVSLLVSLISRCLFPIKGLSPPSWFSWLDEYHNNKRNIFWKADSPTIPLREFTVYSSSLWPREKCSNHAIKLFSPIEVVSTVGDFLTEKLQFDWLNIFVFLRPVCVVWSFLLGQKGKNRVLSAWFCSGSPITWPVSAWCSAGPCAGPQEWLRT